MFAALMSILSLAGAGPSGATASDAPPSAASQPAKKTNGAETVCWDEKPTGSHVTKHLCATREELERAQREGQDAITGVHRDKHHGPGPS